MTNKGEEKQQQQTQLIHLSNPLSTIRIKEKEKNKKGKGKSNRQP